MLMTLILPFACTLIPLFVMYKNFGWIGTYLPLEVPTFFGSSIFSTFLLRQFFMTIPQSLSEAARIDGANEFYIYSRIILPLAKPAMAIGDPVPVHLLLERLPRTTGLHQQHRTPTRCRSAWR